jgi:putative tricarboxylic transport membrane protein
MSDDAPSAESPPAATGSQAVGSMIFAAVGLAIFIFVLFETMSFSPEARPFPRFIAVMGILSAAFAFAQSFRAVRAARGRGGETGTVTRGRSRRDMMISYIGPPLYGAMLLLLGFWAASVVFLAGLLIVLGERRAAVVAAITVGTLGTIYLVFEKGFGIRLPGSLLLQMLSA